MESKPITTKQLVTRILLPGLGLLVILWACNAPSFPLPPPGPESMAFEQQGTGLISLSADPNPYIPPSAEIVVMNMDLRVGVICYAATDGSFDCGPLYGDAGHLVKMTFTDPVNEKRGGSMCYVVSFGGPPAEDSRCGE